MDRRQLMLAAALGASSLRGGTAQAAEADTRTFTSGGATVAAEWFAAAGAASGVKVPALLLLHGADGLAGGDRYRLGARLVAAAGYHVGLLHYLDRTGESRVSYATLAARYPVWAATVADGVAWLATQPGVDPSRLGLVGISLGAALALSTAAADERVKAVVAYSGPLPQGLAEGEPRLPPTLILHGEADRIVPARNALELEALLKRVGSPVESRIYPGQGHVLTGEAQFDSASRVASFLDRYLKAA